MMSGWWCNNHLEKYYSMGRIIPYMKWKNKIHVLNHQPVMLYPPDFPNAVKIRAPSSSKCNEG